MPLPTPNENEQKDDFMSRCMSSEAIKEFDDQKQRIAVCYSQWRKKHPSDKPPQAETYHYLGGLHSPFEKDGKYYALFRAITTQPSGPSLPYGERWRPSYESMRRCLGTFLKAPLLGPPKKGHNATEVHGKPIDWTMPNGYADIIYEITKEAYDNLQSGNWGDVSPQIRARKQHQEGNVTVLDDWVAEHLAFVDEGAFKNVEAIDWWQGNPDKWYRLAAELCHGHSESGVAGEELTDGASSTLIGPQDADHTGKTQGGISLKNETSDSQIFKGAEAWDTADAPDKFFAYVPEGGNPSERKLPLASVEKKDYDEAIVQNALARFPQTDLPASAKAEVLAKIQRIARQLGIEVSDEEGEGVKGGTQTMDQDNKSNTNPKPTEDKTKDFEAEITRLQGENAKLTQKLELFEAGNPTKHYQAEIERISKNFDDLNQKWLQKEADERATKVAALVQARVDAGLIDERDRVTEAKKYESFSAEVLDGLIQDFEAVATVRRSGGPKWQFSAARSDNALEESIEKQLFGSVKPKEDK